MEIKLNKLGTCLLLISQIYILKFFVCEIWDLKKRVKNIEEREVEDDD